MVSKSAVYIYLRSNLTAGGPPPSDGVERSGEWSGAEWSEVERSGAVSKSAVYIYLRSILTAGVPDSTFFSD